MKFEGKHFCPVDLIYDIIKIALAATEEKENTVTYGIVVDISKMVSYVYMIPLIFTQGKKITYIYLISYFTYHYLSMHFGLKLTNIFLLEWM